MKKKIVSFMLALMLVISLVACSSNSIYGKWKMEADITDTIKGQLEKSLGTTIETDRKFFSYTEMTLNKDGTFSYVIDMEKMEESMHNFVESIAPHLEAYIYNTLEQQGISKENADQIFEAQKGMSIQEYVKKELSATKLNANATSTTGYYKVDGSKLYFASSKEALEDCEDYYVFEQSGDKLTFTEGHGKYSPDASSFPVVMPMEFKRQ